MEQDVRDGLVMRMWISLAYYMNLDCVIFYSKYNNSLLSKQTLILKHWSVSSEALNKRGLISASPVRPNAYQTRVMTCHDLPTG